MACDSINRQTSVSQWFWKLNWPQKIPPRKVGLPIRAFFGLEGPRSLALDVILQKPHLEVGFVVVVLRLKGARPPPATTTAVSNTKFLPEKIFRENNTQHCEFVPQSNGYGKIMLNSVDDLKIPFTITLKTTSKIEVGKFRQIED